MHVSQSIHRAALYSAACGKSDRRNYPLVNTQAIFYINTALFQRLFRRQGSLRSSVNSKNISLKNPIHTSNCLGFFFNIYTKKVANIWALRYTLIILGYGVWAKVEPKLWINKNNKYKQQQWKLREAAYLPDTCKGQVGKRWHARWTPLHLCQHRQ